MHVYGNYMWKKQCVGLLVYLLDIHTRTRHSGHQRTGRWPAYGRHFVLVRCVTCVRAYHLKSSITSNYEVTAAIIVISSTKPRPLHQKVITKQGWELSYWGVNAVNQCYDNTPLKRPNTPPLLGVAPNTLT